MADKRGIKRLAARMRRAIRHGTQERFRHAFEGNAYDWDTSSWALAVFLDHLEPGEWQRDDFGHACAAMVGYIDWTKPELPQTAMVVATMSRWLASPLRSLDDPMIDFAEDLLRRRRGRKEVARVRRVREERAAELDRGAAGEAGGRDP